MRSVPTDQSPAGELPQCLLFQSALLTEMTTLSKCFCQLLWTDKSLQTVSKFTPESTFNYVCTTDQGSPLIPSWATLHKTKQTSSAFFHVLSVFYKVFQATGGSFSGSREHDWYITPIYKTHSPGASAQDLLLLSHLGATRKLVAHMFYWKMQFQEQVMLFQLFFLKQSPPQDVIHKMSWANSVPDTQRGSSSAPGCPLHPSAVTSTWSSQIPSCCQLPFAKSSAYLSAQ